MKHLEKTANQQLADTMVEKICQSLRDRALLEGSFSLYGITVTVATPTLKITKVDNPMGGCAKQKVTATLIAKDGTEFIGTNYCRSPQEVCPRDTVGYKSDEGYHMCKDICQQVGHAAVVCIDLAGDMAKDRYVYLEGCTYVCEPCKEYAKNAGVKDIIVDRDDISPLARYLPYDVYVAKEDLIIGQTYFCKARNFAFGTWNGENFDYMRTKFGSTFPDTEKHWDDGAPHGTVKPFAIQIN